jgi:hypothetical protein
MTKLIQRHIEERGLVYVSHFKICARHSTTLQRMWVTDHVALNFSNNIFTTAVFLDIETAFDTTWRTDILYTQLKLEFPRF